MITKVKEAVNFLHSHGFSNPEIGIILGTGLGALADEIEVEATIEYANIPHFPIATIEFHRGKLIYGILGGKKVVVMQGRFHYYEGHSMAEVVFPVRVLKMLGIQKLMISNAGGCMNLNWKKGELMLIEDHINLQPDSPLRGKDAMAFGSIFTDMSNPYDRSLNETLNTIAQEKNIKLNRGTYVSVAGPNLETKAEYRFLRQIGADVVGMSTVPEVIVANQMDLPVCAVSVLTDDCDPDDLKPINIDDIIATAEKAEKDLVKIFYELLMRL